MLALLQIGCGESNSSTSGVRICWELKESKQLEGESRLLWLLETQKTFFSGSRTFFGDNRQNLVMIFLKGLFENLRTDEFSGALEISKLSSARTSRSIIFGCLR